MADPAKPGGRRRGALVPATIGVKRRISRAQLAQLRNPVIRKGSHEGVVDAALIRAIAIVVALAGVYFIVRTFLVVKVCSL